MLMTPSKEKRSHNHLSRRCSLANNFVAEQIKLSRAPISFEFINFHTFSSRFSCECLRVEWKLIGFVQAGVEVATAGLRG